MCLSRLAACSVECKHYIRAYRHFTPFCRIYTLRDCKLSATASRRTPTTCVTWPTTTVRNMMPHRTSIEVRCSRATRRRRRRPRTPPCPLPSTTAKCVLWRRWIHALHWCLAATAVSVAHVLKRCKTEDSVVLCVEVRFKCFCVCFNCVSRFFRMCVRCAVSFNLDMRLLENMR